MEDFIKIAGICLVAAILGAVLDRRDHALAVSLGLLACVAALIVCTRAFSPVARFLADLTDLSGVSELYFGPLLKTTGIGIVTQVACAVCTDAGQNAMAKASELCGICAAIVLGLPLMQAALDVIRQMMGG